MSRERETDRYGSRPDLLPADADATFRRAPKIQASFARDPRRKAIVKRPRIDEAVKPGHLDPVDEDIDNRARCLVGHPRQGAEGDGGPHSNAIGSSSRGRETLNMVCACSP